MLILSAIICYLLKFEYFLVSLLCDSKLNIFVLRTKQDI